MYQYILKAQGNILLNDVGLGHRYGVSAGGQRYVIGPLPYDIQVDAVWFQVVGGSAAIATAPVFKFSKGVTNGSASTAGAASNFIGIVGGASSSKSLYCKWLRTSGNASGFGQVSQNTTAGKDSLFIPAGGIILVETTNLGGGDAAITPTDAPPCVAGVVVHIVGGGMPPSRRAQMASMANAKTSALGYPTDHTLVVTSVV